MSKTNLALPPPKEFEIDSGNVSKRWKSYKEDFMGYVAAVNLADKSQIRATFLHIAGAEVKRIFRTYGKSDADDEIEKVFKSLDKYFVEPENKDYLVLALRECKQKPEEELREYVVRLRETASECGYTETHLEEEVRNQLIVGCRSAKLRAEILKNKARMALEDNLLVVRRSKLVKERETFGAAEAEVAAVREHGGAKWHGSTGESVDGKKCPTCSYRLPHNRQCPAIGQKCIKCGEPGHFARVCKGQKKTLNMMTAERRHDSSEEEWSWVYAVGSQDDTTRPLKKVNINGFDINMLVDSGAPYDIIDEDAYKRLNAIKLERAKLRLHAYGNKGQSRSLENSMQQL